MTPIDALRAAAWSVRAFRHAGGHLRRGGRLEDVTVPDVPRLPDEAGRVVEFVVRHGSLRGLPRQTCLVQSYVRQAWYAARGVDRDLVIGVRTPGDDFWAHAWLDGDPPGSSEGFHELLRLPVR